MQSKSNRDATGVKTRATKNRELFHATCLTDYELPRCTLGLYLRKMVKHAQALEAQSIQCAAKIIIDFLTVSLACIFIPGVQVGIVFQQSGWYTGARCDALSEALGGWALTFCHEHELPCASLNDNGEGCQADS